jgi:ankyrin repeat protein
MQDGWTSLRYAVRKGHDKVVEVLVRAGADMNSADKVRHTFPFELLPRAALRLWILCRERHSHSVPLHL